jgi:hypothetical protein
MSRRLRRVERLGRYPWCDAPFSGWSECPGRRDCLKGKVEYCVHPERRYEYYGERLIYRSWGADI